VLRELEAAYHDQGDEVRSVTFTARERSLPVGLRQVVFMLRVLPRIWWADSILMLDTASTAPALVLAGWLLRKHTVVRIGGDFLWETYVDRTKEPLLLSEFYDEPRLLSKREKSIRAATVITLRLASALAFTTKWQRRIWEKGYHVNSAKTRVIANALPERTPVDDYSGGFLAAARDAVVKNGRILDAVWEMVTARHPDAILDRTQRSPEGYEAALAASYAIIVPSLSEVSPNAIFEAIRLGKPFITTLDTGVYDDFKDIGIFVDTRDAEAIADAVIALLDPALYREAVRRVRSFDQVRTWTDVAQEFKRALLPY
jgi:hypothetical protein